MKKVKIMFTALAILALVGGALAYKATKGSFIFCGTQNAVAGGAACPLYLNSTATPTFVNPTIYCTVTANTPCTIPALNLAGKQ
jgi:hypothetical protein